MANSSTASASKTLTTPLRLVFDGKQQVRSEAFSVKDPGPNEIRIRSMYSLMSTGTENIVFNRLFDAGTNWDRWVQYPFYPGYAIVGIVEAIGPDVTRFSIGERVTCRMPHASHQIAHIDHVTKVPLDIDPKLATWFALAKIAYGSCRAADFHVGDSALVIGAGPIGQMAVRWAFASGVTSLIVVDMLANRLRLAESGGATSTIAVSIDSAQESVKAANGGKLPRVVIDTTGNAKVFSSALTLAADRGTVVLLGDTGTPTQQTLTGDVLIRGLTIVGTHDGNWEYNPSYISDALFLLSRSGRFPLEGLNTHTFKPNQCLEAYETANRHRGETMGIIFDWT